MATVRAQETEDEVEVFDVDEIVDDDEDYEIGPSDDIETAFMFPEYPENKLALGEIIKVLFLFNNKGDSIFNVTHVMASLRSPYDYNYHIQNFSIMPVGILVQPGRQASFEYLFKPDPNLDPEEFWLTTEVIYNSSEDRMYKNAIFNGTVELIEKGTEVDVKRFFKYLMTFAILGGAVYYFFLMNMIGTKSKKTKTSYTKPKAGGEAAVEEEEEVLELKGQARADDGTVRNRRVTRRKSSKNKKGGKRKK